MLRTLEERQIRFVRLWFTDVLGTLKSVAVAPAELDGAFDEGIGFDGSAIEGFARASESDMLARPDPSTFQILPGADGRPGRLRADVLRHHRCPTARRPGPIRATCCAARCPRPPSAGFTFYTHPEIEFFLLKNRPDRRHRAGADRQRRLLRHDQPRHRARLPARGRQRAGGARASRSSSATTRSRRASRRSTCATPTRCRWPTTS